MPTGNPITPATVMPTGRRMDRFTARSASGAARAVITMEGVITGTAAVGTVGTGTVGTGTVGAGTAVDMAATTATVVIHGAAAAGMGDMGDMGIDAH